MLINIFDRYVCRRSVSCGTIGFENYNKKVFFEATGFLYKVLLLIPYIRRMGWVNTYWVTGGIKYWWWQAATSRLTVCHWTSQWSPVPYFPSDDLFFGAHKLMMSCASVGKERCLAVWCLAIVGCSNVLSQTVLVGPMALLWHQRDRNPKSRWVK